jgi:hypothetical protein
MEKEGGREGGEVGGADKAERWRREQTKGRVDGPLQVPPKPDLPRPPGLSDEEILKRLLELNLERAQRGRPVELRRPAHDRSLASGNRAAC